MNWQMENITRTFSPFSVWTGDGFARDVLCAGLPNLHERCATIRFWSRLPRCAILDSSHWRWIPMFHLKIGRSLAQFTTRGRRWCRDGIGGLPLPDRTSPRRVEATV